MTDAALAGAGVDTSEFDAKEVDNFTNDSAMMIAWERDLESQRPDALFNDPTAKILAGTKGQKLSDEFGPGMCKIFDFEGWEDFHKTWVAVRTRFLDDRVAECAAAAAAGTTPFAQLVNLGAGMDTRPFRMECVSAFPNGVVEVDMAVINEGKRKMFGDHLGSAAPLCAVEIVDLNFLDEDKTLATELGAAAGSRFDAARPTVFLAEGLIMYLGAIGKVKFIKDVSAVAAPGSVLVLQFLDASQSSSAKDNPAALANALSQEEATEELTKHGWEDLEFSMFGDEKLNFGRYPNDRFKPSAGFSFCVCRKKKMMAKAPIDVTGLTYKAKHDDNLEADPADAKFRIALVGCYVDSHPTGGSDKVTSGHRFDTVGIANGLKHAGLAVQIVFYNIDEHDRFFEVVSKFDAIVMRINPGQITANGGDQQKFDVDMTKVAAKIPVWPTPKNMDKMGAKDALTKIRDMDFGLPDTLGYYSPDELKVGFPKTIAFQRRVVKQNRGSAGEGIWIIDLKEKNYCPTYGERVAELDEVLVCKEANDNHIEEHTIAEFIEWCENGRKWPLKAGSWTSKGNGKYFEGGVEAGGQMVDQRFCPRIDEGEARFVFIGKKLFRVEHYVYIGGVGGETKTTIYPADAHDFPDTEALPLGTVQKKLEAELEDYVKALGLSEKDIPLLWAADFIPVDDHKTPMVIGEFNCSCLGLAGFLDARGKDLTDLTPEQMAMGQEMADKIGALAREQLEAA